MCGWDTDILGWDTEILIEILQNLKITKFLHMLWGTPISYPESLRMIHGSMAYIWAAIGLEA